MNIHVLDTVLEDHAAGLRPSCSVEKVLDSMIRTKCMYICAIGKYIHFVLGLPVEGLLDVEGLELVNVFTVLCELALADTVGCL